MGEAVEEIDAEALVKRIEETGSAEPEVAETIEEAPPEPEIQKFKYTALGKEIEEPIDMILQRASMGYNYAQKMAEFKKQQQEFEQRQQVIQEMEQKWKPYDEYARQNPEWYQHWSTAWERRTSPNQGDEFQSGHQAIPPALQEKLSAFEKFMEEQQAAKQAEVVQREDEALANEVRSIQEEFPDIDFQSTDPVTGKSLEQQVLDHAITNGIPTFRAAFRDFYHETLVSRAAERAKEEFAKKTQSDRKKGIIGRSPTPFQNGGDAVDTKTRSWEQLERLAAQELGIET